jgi:hypothetical protein
MADKISPKIEALANQATDQMTYAVQVLASGKATPTQFTQAKKLFGRFVMYAERPKPGSVSQGVYDRFVAAAKKLGKALVEYQNVVIEGNGANGTSNGAGYFSAPEDDEFVEVDEVEYAPPPELLPITPVPAGEPPGFIDFVVESVTEHPLAWGAVAIVAAGVGYTVGKRRTP